MRLQVLFCITQKTIRYAMIRLNPKDIFPITPDSIWNEHNLLMADDKEKHRCIVIASIQPTIEPLCIPVASELVIVNHVLLMQRQQLTFVPAPLKLLARCKGLDFLTTHTQLGSHLLYRDSKQKLHYLGRKTGLKFINNELIVINDTLYQNFKGKLIEVTMFNARSSFAGYEGDMPIIHEAMYSEQDPNMEGYFYYKKDANGIFKFDHSDIK